MAVTSPPVQDSAVAIVSFLARQRSSSTRAIPRSSSSYSISVAPGQANGRVGEGGYAFAASRETELFAGGRLDRHATDGNARDLGDASSHGVAIRPDARRFAHDSCVEMGDTPATRLHSLDCEGQEAIRRRAPPLRIARGEVHADITL